MTAEPKTERRVRADDLLAFVVEAFRRCGMGADDAALLADTLVQADLRGVHSHGVLRVPEYVKKLTVDGVDPRGRPLVARDGGACLVVDGGNSMGQVGAQFAIGDRWFIRGEATFIKRESFMLGFNYRFNTPGFRGPVAP